MSFEFVKNYINSIETQEEISLDSLFGLFVAAINDVGDVYSANIGNTEEYVINLIPVVELMNHSMDPSNSRAVNLSKVDSMLVDGLKELTQELKQTQEKLITIRDNTKEKENERAKLETESQMLNAERGHLLKVQEECEQLQKEIDRLNDPYLDELVQKKSTLVSNLIPLQKKEKELLNDIDEKENEYQKVKKSRDELQKTYDTLQGKVDSNNKFKKGLEQGIENQKKLLEKFEQWHKDFDKRNAELKNKTTTINNIIKACNAFIKKDSTFIEAIDFNSLNDDEKSIITFGGEDIENLDQLNSYFDSYVSKTDDMIQLYSKVLTEFQKITEENLNPKNTEN